MPQWPAGQARAEEPEGSAIVIGDGSLIATADHVIGVARSVLVRTTAGEILPAEIVLRHRETDIAFLKLPKALTPLEPGGEIKAGEPVCAVGNSFGLGISVTCGVVSALGLSGTGFNLIEDFVQTDAAVNPGMSGGALVTGDGRLVGMLSAIFTKQSDANIGVNFAVSSRLLDKIYREYELNGNVALDRSGVLLRPVPAAGQPGIVGAEVVRVVAGSPEETAGILVSDIILSAASRRIKRAGAYEAARFLASGGLFTLEVLRGGEIIAIEVSLK